MLFSLIIRATQMKTWTEISLFTCQFSTYPSEMTALGEAVEKGALSYTAGGWAKLYNPMERDLATSGKTTEASTL